MNTTIQLKHKKPQQFDLSVKNTTKYLTISKVQLKQSFVDTQIMTKQIVTEEELKPDFVRESPNSKETLQGLKVSRRVTSKSNMAVDKVKDLTRQPTEV